MEQIAPCDLAALLMPRGRSATAKSRASKFPIPDKGDEMRRMRWLTMAGIAIAGLFVAVPARARSTSGSSTSELNGTVEKLDRASKEMTLAESGGKLTVSDETQILKDGRRAAFSDVKEGDVVRASYAGDPLHVTTIE